MMTTLTRKQREIAEREQLIKDVARRLLVQEGYLGLNMDRIADAIEYSKGTVYLHFSSKEDLVGALTVETMERRAEMFARAADFDGRPRERICAIGVADELFFKLHPDHFWSEHIVRVNSIAEKVSRTRRGELICRESSCLDTLLGIVRDAIAVGDLVLPEDAPDCQVLFGLRSMAIGAHTLDAHIRELPALEDADTSLALWRNYQRLLDGYGWTPLSTEWDYHATIERVYEEVFPDEHQQLRQQNDG